MQRALFIKAVLVAAVFIVVLIPLSMIHGIVSERAARQQAVAQEIASGSFGKQIFAGIVLSMPYTEEYDVQLGEGRDRRTEKRQIERVLRLFPARSELTGKVQVGEKHRGLFRVRTFEWDLSAHGELALDGKTTVERTRSDSRIVWGEAVISVGLSDPRGLSGTPVIEWEGRPIAFERGSALAGMPSGLHATVPAFDVAKPQRLAYAIRMNLQGTQSLAVVPLADSNRITLKSDWPHPSFRGQFLPQPQSQQIGKEGFSAQWAITALASNVQQQLQSFVDAKKDGLQAIERLEVAFIEPIDIYSLSDRAVKYGFLFVGLTFGCFLVFEVLKRLPIHPAQYALAGLALAAFFLLLIALSEHIAFWMAYLIAAASCITLMGYYLSAVLGGARRGLSFATMLTALYSALYGLLVSEDNALLLGSLLVFGVIALAMVLTRKVDWYRLGADAAESNEQTSVAR